MELKVMLFINRGMLRDLSVSKFNSEFAYENMNIRITADRGSNLLSVTNEKGNKESLIVLSNEEPLEIKGSYLGYGVLNNIIILFTTSDEVDRIYRLLYTESGNFFRGKILYLGSLNFNIDHPIESLCIFENEDILKIYWIDGLNQPRVANISENFRETDYTDTSFDFAQDLILNEEISVSKNLVSSGMFPPGTIQYAFSYYNKYAQETALFYTSPLQYTSFNNRGGSPEDKVSNSFNISIINADPNFDYLRVYSILRTSLNTTPAVKRVVDLPIFTKESILTSNEIPYSIYTPYVVRDLQIYKINGTYSSLQLFFKLEYSVGQTLVKTYEIPESTELIVVDRLINKGFRSIGSGLYIFESKAPDEPAKYTITAIIDNITISDYRLGEIVTTIKYIDNGLSGDFIDPTELLFKGSDNIIAGSIALKDNTLFLGNLKLNLNIISPEIVSSLKSWLSDVVFELKQYGIKPPEPKGYYPYETSLNYSSETIKTFKYLDWYRLGVLFQHKSGKWSEPIFIKDLLNTIPIKSNFEESDEIQTVFAKYKISLLNISRLTQLGFIRARTVISYPDISDREVLALGILAPTVFNMQDRYTNTPFALSSWFMRPNAPFDFDNDVNSWVDIDTGLRRSLNSKSGYWENNNHRITFPDGVVNFDTAIKGSWCEFRHLTSLPESNKRNAEIQSNYNEIEDRIGYPLTDKTSSGDVADFVSKYSDKFFIDQSIFTFHSPEIEFDDSILTMDSKNLKLRIVGQVPITSNISDVDIQTSTPVSDNKYTGFYKELVGNTNISRLGAKSLNSAVLWIDGIVKGTKTIFGNWGYDKMSAGYLIYPWHRNGSLNNSGVPEDDEGPRTAMLDKKKMSNLRYSYGTHYYNKEDIWNAYKKNDPNKTGISGVEIFNSNETTLTKISAPKNSNLDDITYYGNVDKIITSKEYPIIATRGTGIENDKLISNGEHFRGDLTIFNRVITPEYEGTEPIRMKYKSTPHGVMALNFTEDSRLRVLPTISSSDPSSVNLTRINSAEGLNFKTGRPFWDTDNNLRVRLDVISSFQTNGNVNGIGYGFLWLAELYNDNVENRFGGTSDEAIENNLWLPGGEPVSLLTNEGIPKDTATILYTEGDTFYGRYDCLKTYPFTKEDLNSIVDITSFMVESRINLDGRYDRNRGQVSNLNMSPENFNKMNNVYSQPNNYFNYRALNNDRFLLNDFRNSIVWSRTKALGELTDTWTNLSLASTLDLDGDKGPINALARVNNEILAFLNTGVSRILFNSRIQLNPSDGVPIEIANSGKVDGKVYMSETIGCTNKWSIVNSKSGLYFHDDLGKAIYRFTGEGFSNITDELGFNAYFKSVSSTKKWNSTDFENFINFYDNINGDIYFINKNQSLAFSEKIGLFSSFYNYEKTPLMFNIGDNTFTFRDNKIWQLFAGKYNSFFGETKPFYTTFIANDEPHLNKVFGLIDFRADTWNDSALLDDVTFDKLEVWNEYQHGTSNLNMTRSKDSTLLKKFRVWRAKVPRIKRDRIRNPWAFVKLTMDKPEHYKTELHDIIIHYFA